MQCHPIKNQGKKKNVKIRVSLGRISNMGCILSVGTVPLDNLSPLHKEKHPVGPMIIDNLLENSLF